MLSYRHAFHAGNFADVHKHAAFTLGITSLLKKPAPFCVLDAYAGAGEYDLADPMAEKTGEWRAGIGRVMGADEPPESLQPYLEAIRAFNGGDRLLAYPGSPALAASLLREQDRLVCFELHPTDHARLSDRFAKDNRVQVHRRDAREGLPALLPPHERRGLVLVDPPYERAEEYREVPEALRRAWQRWPSGSYLLWYPLLAGNPHEEMIASLCQGDIRKILVHEMRLFPAARGLQGSGLLWISPPWQIEAALAEMHGWLARVLDAQAAVHSLEWRVRE